MHLPLPIILLWLDAARPYHGVNLHKDNTCCPQVCGTTCDKLHQVLDPEILGWGCWTSSLQRSFFGCQKLVSHLTLGAGFSSRLCTSPSDNFYLWVLTDRLAACPTAEWCLGRTPEPRQAEGQRDKKPALLGKAGSCEETFCAGDGVCAMPATWRAPLGWDAPPEGMEEGEEREQGRIVSS